MQQTAVIKKFHFPLRHSRQRKWLKVPIVEFKIELRLQVMWHCASGAITTLSLWYLEDTGIYLFKNTFWLSCKLNVSCFGLKRSKSKSQRTCNGHCVIWTCQKVSLFVDIKFSCVRKLAWKTWDTTTLETNLLYAIKTLNQKESLGITGA